MSSLTNNNQPLCTNINLDNTIYKNTISRSIILDKIEYYLIYSHDTIPKPSNIKLNYNNVEHINIGNIVLYTKPSINNNNITKYISDNELKALLTVNQSLLSNDAYLINKIVLILEGKYNGKELLKLDNKENKLKIISNVKEGINLVLFSCDLIIENIQRHRWNEVLNHFSEMFATKKKISEEYDNKIKDLIEDEQKVSEKLTFLEREMTVKENNMLSLFCRKLNEKKRILKDLKQKINYKGLDMKIDNENNVRYSNFSNNSINISNSNIPGNNSELNKSNAKNEENSLFYSQNNLSLSDL